MQYFGRAIGTVSRTWNSLNPSTLSGAIDVVVIKQPDGELSCSAFHIRFGKISLLRPSHKGVDFYVNDVKINVQMKLGEGGEAFFVFPTEDDVPENLLTSPVVSPSASPNAGDDAQEENADVEFLDITQSADKANDEEGKHPMSYRSGTASDGDYTNSPDSRHTQEMENNCKSVITQKLQHDLEDDANSNASSTYSTPRNGRSVSPAHGKITAEELHDSVFKDPEDAEMPLDTNELADGVHGDTKSDKDEDSLEPRLRHQDPEQIDEIIKRLREVRIPSTKDNNGSVIMDMTGYKAGGQNTKELEHVVTNLLDKDAEERSAKSPIIDSPPGSPEYRAHVQRFSEEMMGGTDGSGANGSSSGSGGTHYVKTLRLSSDMLQNLNLNAGQNEMKFVVRSNGASIKAHIHLWDANTPVVISDIDGTITKSDAMGHIMTLVGRDWTHAGVGRLFSDIARNGYNIMYLTSRSVGLADATRGYLRSIDQNGYKLPLGPVILSPDRTMAALRREVIMRKPEIFKMACLRDILKLYDTGDDMVPFYAGFGNRITDGLSYRSVGVPSTKIFTINTESEVKLELLELTGVKSSYLLITDLVDQLFPPVLPEQKRLHQLNTVGFSDTNFWKAPLPDLSEEEDSSEEETITATASVRSRLGSTLGSRLGRSPPAPSRSDLSPKHNNTSATDNIKNVGEPPLPLTGTQRGLDWETNLNATFIDDDEDESSADEDYEDSGAEDEEYATDSNASQSGDENLDGPLKTTESQ